MLSHLLSATAPPRRVVVLGSRGFLGRELCGSLSGQGWACRALTREDVDLSDPGAARVLAPLLEPSDALVMTSALTPDRGRDVGTLMTNLRMAECVAQVLAQRPVEHLVYISSDAVYDGRQALISEDTAPSPTDLYSLMHVARERILGHAAQAAGVPLCTLRPSAVFGAADTHNSYGPNRFIRGALKDRRIQLFGGGEETRDHVFVDDVVRLIQSVLERRSKGVLNAVSGQAVSFQELAQRIRSGVGGEVSIESLPRTGPVTHRQFDTTALARSLPGLRSTPLGDGLQKMIEAIRAGGGGSVH